MIQSRLAVLLISITLLSSCAKKFHTIEPSSFNFENRFLTSGPFKITYVYDVQHLEHNKRYAEDERKQSLKLIALKVENITNEPVEFRNEKLTIRTASGRVLPFIDRETYTKRVRQKVENYLIYYGLAGIGIYYDSNSGTQVTYNPIPLLIGIGNGIYAGIANNKQKKNLRKCELHGQTIPAHGTAYGLVITSEKGYSELVFEYDQ